MDLVLEGASHLVILLVLLQLLLLLLQGAQPVLDGFQELFNLKSTRKLLKIALLLFNIFLLPQPKLS